MKAQQTTKAEKSRQRAKEIAFRKANTIEANSRALEIYLK